MGTFSEAEIDFASYIDVLDKKLSSYFKKYEKYIFCDKGCSYCCEKGDYPISEIEFQYLTEGFLNLDYETRKIIQNNIKKMEEGGCCPFLINKTCSVYSYRPIICRVHGLAYLQKNGMVNVPYCANIGKNFSEVYENGEFLTEPIKENLSTNILLENLYKSLSSNDYPIIKNMYDWLSQ